MRLLEGFRAQAGAALMFLKSVRSAAVYVQDEGQPAPRLLFRASLDAQARSLPCTGSCAAIGAAGWASSVPMQSLQGRIHCRRDHAAHLKRVLSTVQ